MPTSWVRHASKQCPDGCCCCCCQFHLVQGSQWWRLLDQQAWLRISAYTSAGFETADAIALLRLDDLYVECFEIKDVKVCGLLLTKSPSAAQGSGTTGPDQPFLVQTLRGEHMSRCIGRLAGKVSDDAATMDLHAA